MTLSNAESNPATSGVLRSAQRLLTRKGRQHTKKFLVEGPQAVREALKIPGLVQRLLVVDISQHHALLAETNIKNSAIEIFTITEKEFKKLSDTVSPQGILAICQQLEAKLADIAAPKLVVICAQIRDPGNAGTVIRSADAFGADAVLMTTGSVELHNPKTVRSSVGSIFHLPIITGITTAEAATWCHDQGLQILAADADGVLLTELSATGELAKPTAWLMGNEAWGLPAEELGYADQVTAIPMWGKAESLNLSTAATVCLYTSAVALK